MTVATFDTLKFANTLKAAGVPPQQAEAQAQAFAEVIQLNFKDLVTKEDLDRVAKATKDDIAAVRAEIDRVANDLRSEIDRVAKAAKADLDQAVKDLRRDNADLRTELKHDIAELRTELKHDVAELRTGFKHEIQTAQAKAHSDHILLRWMFGAAFAVGLGIIGLLVRILFVMGR